MGYGPGGPDNAERRKDVDLQWKLTREHMLRGTMSRRLCKLLLRAESSSEEGVIELSWGGGRVGIRLE